MRKTHVATVTLSSVGSRRPSPKDKFINYDVESKLDSADSVEEKSQTYKIDRVFPNFLHLEDVERHEPVILTHRTKHNEPLTKLELQ